MTHFPRPHRALFVFTTVCLVTAFAAGVFVAARGGGSETPGGRAAAQTASSAPVDANVKARVAQRFGRMPLSFEVNEGQIDPAVKFLSRGPGYDLFLTSTEAVLSLRKPLTAEKDPRQLNPAEVGEGSVLRLKMIGANAAAQVEGRDELPGKVNYFTGDDPEKWRRKISTYRKVYYKDVYPGIDIVYYGNQRELEYDFIIAPGADPKVIKFRIDGADRIHLDTTGSLRLALKHGEVRLNKPFIYQLNEKGSRSEVKGAYTIKGNEISFKVRGFDSRKPLVIDPILSYATFLGANGQEHGLGIAVDSQGSAYVTGVTASSTFPTTAGAFKTTSQSGAAFVTKLDPTGSSLVYSTFLGGTTSTSTGTSIAVDAAGNAYVAGHTSSTDFPTVNGLKTTSNFFKTTDAASNWININTGLPGDVRAIAVAPNAPNTIYAGVPGGPYRSVDGGATWTKTPTSGLSGFPFANSMSVDPTNSAIVYLGPITGGLFRSTNGGNNWSAVNVPLNNASVFSIVFDPVTPSTVYVASGAGVYKSIDSGTTWTSLNNFGLSNASQVRALAVDPTTPATMYAGTAGTPGMFKTTNGGGSWTTMNSGMINCNTVNAIVLDPFNAQTIYAACGSFGSGSINKSVNGGTSWTTVNDGVPPNFPITAMVADRTNASTIYAATAGGGVLKTTNGGTNWTRVNTGLWKTDILALVAHPTNSSILFAGGGGTTQPDAFITKLNVSGSGLLFSTLLGGSKEETGNGIAVDGSGNIYVVGQTTSPNFPAVNAAQSAPSATENCVNGFVTKINPAVPSYVFSTYLGGSTCDVANSVALDQSANVYVSGNTNSTDFPLAAAFQPAIGGQFNTDAFVTKLTTGGALTYSTYLGGDGTDTGQGIAVDAAGNAHVTGLTTSTNFPTLNPIQPSNGGGAGDVYITKFNAQGSGLVYSTFLGGSDTDIGRGIALDPGGNAYVTGFTRSLGFPLVAGSLGTKSPLYKSVDGAANWNNNNFGLPASIRTLAIHPTQQAGTVFAGTDRGLFKSTNGGKHWTLITNGIPVNDVRVIVFDSPFTMYAVVNDLGFVNPEIRGVYKSIDGGNSWTRRMTGLVHNSVLGLTINPRTPAILYAGTQGGPIYKTTNGGDSWSPTSSPVNLGSPVVDPHTPTTVFAGDDFGSFIYRSIDSGATWQQIGAIDPGPQGRIAVSPHTPGLVYASGRNFNLFRSDDRGDNWTLVRSGAGTIVFDPVSPSTVYLASFNEGVLKSTNNGQTWTPMNKGLKHTFAMKLAVDPLKPSTLYLASTPVGSDEDAFVTKINPSGSTLIYSTLVGGATPPEDPFSAAADTAFAIAVDSAGNAYVTGLSRSDFHGTPNSFQPLNRGVDDAFIAKLSMSHVISGRVKTSTDDGVSEAEVVLNDGTSIRSVFTESDGSYEFSNLREGGNFTVSASKPRFTITPATQSFNNLTSNQTFDFTAMMNDSTFHTISGQVTNNGVGLADVTVTLSGSQSGLRTTDANGNYSFDLLLGGNYTVTPSILGFTFGTPSQTFNPLSAPQTANFTATRQNFVVTNTNNHGTGSLREAMTNANATVGADTIVFNIPGAGVKVINLLNVLPEIIDPVVIDGTTQPGYAGTPLIELDGFNIGTGSGLVVKAGGTTVRGLALVRFRDLGILLNSCDNNVIQANHIGVNAAGTTGRGNNTGIRLTNSNNNTIGGTTAAARNVISGNSFDGIDLGGNGNVIQGNYIGTNAAGAAAVPNGISGVSVSSAPFTNNLIGGTSPGAGNLISGNQRGISLNGPGNTVQGNLIGTDHTGTNKVPNGTGVHSSFSVNTVIGGVTPGARNIISGNSGNGIYLAGSGTIQGNYIGTDITGTLPLGNENTGVVAGNGPLGGNGVLIGGTTPEARNIIAANGGFGNVALGENSSGSAATMQGNYIGTDVTGTKALGLNTQAGVSIFSNNNVVGGTVAGAQNVISGHRFGLQIGGFISSFPSGNVIQGNLIGLNAQGTGSLGNTQGGVQLAGANNNTIGGTQNGAANKIAFNGGPGVHISSGTGNSVRGNSIFSNNGLGIDLGTTTGVTPNDGTDPDTGPNNLQNFPVVTTLSSNASSTNIQGSLTSTPNTTFQIDFYSNAAVDPSGNGEGGLFFNTTSVTTDSNGVASFDVNFASPLASGRVITATATDPNNNTSEFSAADATRASGSVQFSLTTFFVIEDVGMATVTVERTGGSSGPMSVEYATTDVTATAGQDYTATSGTLNFANGETSKTIQVPILDDSTTEPDETFTVTLKNASSLEALGAPSAMTITIQDKTTVPALFTFNVTVTEGDAGTTDARFEVRLSAATGRTVSVDYATANFNAHGGAACGTLGVDYQTAAGTITFQPGTFSVVVPVQVCGDTSAELNENYAFNLSKAVNATIAVNQGVGTIVNDDVIQLLHEESSPIVNQAAAVDSIFFVRDPFRIVTVPELFANGVDRNTRVVLFVRNLQLNPGETSSAVVVRIIGSNNQIFEVPAEDFRAVPGFDFMQVVFRLPNLPPGTCTAFIRSHGRISNLGTFRIVP